LELVERTEELMLEGDERLLVPLDIVDLHGHVRDFQVPEELLEIK